MGRIEDTPQDQDEANPCSAPSTGRFAVLTNPVRHLEWPGMAAPALPPVVKSSGKPQRKPSTSPAAVESLQANSKVEQASSRVSHRIDTPAPFVTSEVISAFHLQEVQLPTALEEVTKGAARGGKVAIIASIFALASVIGAGVWWSSPGAEIAPPQAVTTSALEPARPTQPSHGETANGAAEGRNHARLGDSSPTPRSSAQAPASSLHRTPSRSAAEITAESAGATSRSTSSRKSAATKSAEPKTHRATSKTATAIDVTHVSPNSGVSSPKPTLVETANHAAVAQRELPASKSAAAQRELPASKPAGAQASAVPRVYRNQ